ncbi:MAG: hypothetical protein KTR24_17900, partial [Saprospiraceae bacterium]|nr:hypothetical protein [Saprospiraceae bacterium]
MPQRLTFFLLLILLFPMRAWSQPAAKKAQFKQYTTMDGLLSNVVNDIIQDSYGFVWVGTSKGLCRFDGSNFVQYQDLGTGQDTMSFHVSKLLLDSRGNLWVATQANGLFRRTKEGGFVHYTHQNNDPESLSDDQIWTLFEDRTGTVWIGTENGICGYLPEVDRFYTLPIKRIANGELPYESIISIAEDHYGRLWLGSWSNGVILVDTIGRSDDEVTHSVHLTFSTPLESNNIWSISFNANTEEIWLGLYHGGIFKTASAKCLAACTADDFEFEHVDYSSELIDDDIIRDIHYDANLASLFLSGRGGLIELDGKTPTESPHCTFWTWELFNPFDQVNSSFIDADLNIWVASNKGLFYSPEQSRILDIHLSDCCDDIPLLVTSVSHQDRNGSLWLTTLDKGLFQYTPSNQQIVQHDILNEGNFSRTSDPGWNDVIWLGGKEGDFTAFHTSSLKQERYVVQEIAQYAENNIRAIHQMDEHHLLICSEAGLYHYDLKERRIIPFPEELSPDVIGRDVSDILKYGDSYFISIAGMGLCKLQFKNGIWEKKLYTQENSGIRTIILFDLDLVGDRIWLGCQTGVQAFDPVTEQFSSFPEIDRYVKEMVLSLTHDVEGNLWFNTSQGIYAYLPAQDRLIQLGQDDGAVSSPHFRTGNQVSETLVAFGGSGGINLIRPAAIASMQDPKTVQVTDFRISNQSIAVNHPDPLLGHPILTDHILVTKEITLHRDHKVITFDFTVVDFADVGKYEYAYFLEGVEQDWNFGTESEVTYTSLNPGDYTLHVKAKNKLGQWTPERRLNVQVLFPFWQRAWFIISCFLLGFILLRLVLWIRERQIRRRNEELENLIGQRTQELEDKVMQLRTKESQLQLRNLELERAIESNAQLEQYAHIASHDLKSPLRTITGFSSLLKRKLETKLDEDEEKYLEFIINGSHEMSNLVDDLLNFSKLGSEHLVLQQIEFSQVLQRTLDLLQADQEEGEIKVYVEDLPGKINCDPVKIGQVLQNLLSNAYKFARKQGQQAEVRIRGEENATFWRVEVEDNGIGIPEKNIKDIFRMFRRLHTHGDFEGTGMGLATCRRIIEKHGGKIWVESTEGHGSKFSFEIPHQLNPQGG